MTIQITNINPQHTDSQVDGTQVYFSGCPPGQPGSCYRVEHKAGHKISASHYYFDRRAGEVLK